MGTSLAAKAAAFRSELARSYLSGQEVQSILRVDVATLTAWRKERRLLAVWHRAADEWLYPDFQFDDGALIKEIPDLLLVYETYDVPPILSSTAIWSPIPNHKEIGREEALFRRTDHRLPA